MYKSVQNIIYDVLKICIMSETSNSFSLGDFLSGSVGLSSMPLSSLIVGLVIISCIILVVICKFNLIPGIEDKIPALRGLCGKKKEVCFAGESCEEPDTHEGEHTL